MQKRINFFTNRPEEGSGLTVVLTAVGVIIFSFLISFIMPDFSESPSFGFFSLFPAVFLVLYIFFTKRIFESLILASIMGLIMCTGNALLYADGIRNFSIAAIGSTISQSMHSFSDTLTLVMMKEDIAWLILVCGLMGSIISMVEKAGGAFAFGEWVARHAKSKYSVMIWTWVLGIVIFLDDYLNALVIGSCMAPLCDKHKSPREFLSFIVDSTAAPACVLIPISTWGVFCGGLLELYGYAPEGQGLAYFIKTIPFNFYAWIGILIVPLFIFNIIKPFGPMKTAEKRVAEGGPIVPPGSEKIDIRGGKAIEKPKNPKIRNFFIPIISLIFFTMVPVFRTGSLNDLSMAIGVYCTLIVCFILYISQKVMNASEYWDCFINGIKNMLNSLILMVLAFLFAEINRKIGFTYYMIHSVESFMSPQLMPLIVFIVLSITEFITGTNWGMYIIALPIVIPLAIDLGVNVPLSIGAVISAGVFGSHICFYSDATVVTSAATGCDNFAHAKTQMPYGILAALITCVFYLVAGFIF